MVELVYPRTCAGCAMRGTWLCPDCEREVPRLTRGLCHRCGAPAQRGCEQCRHLDPAIVMARAAYPYTGWVARAVQLAKYDDEPARLPDIGARLLPLMRDLGPLDALVPVPLHPARLRRRGYNQADVLAREISAVTGVPLWPVIRRIRETRPQVGLTRDARTHNVHDAFALDPAWSPRPGMRFLIVDDVRTTGATLNACANVLAGTSPASVSVMTFAVDLPASVLNPWLEEYGPR